MTPDLEKPPIHVIIGKQLPDGSWVCNARVMTLEDGADYAAYDFDVWIDPWDREALIRYEAMQRVLQRRWFR